MRNQPLCPKIVLAALLLGSAGTASSAVYYISNAGNDANHGKSETAAWRSFRPLDTARIDPGSMILLQRGGVWREQLRLSKSGEPSKPIQIGAYGSTPKRPLILGSDMIPGSLKEGVRSAKAQGLVKSAFANGSFLPIARYPSSEWLSGSLAATNSVQAGNLDGRNWVGASIHVLTGPWLLETRIVTGGSLGVIQFDRGLSYSAQSVQFYLSNHALAMGNSPAWYQRVSDSVVFWNTTHDSLEVSIRPTGIDLQTSSYVKLLGLTIEKTSLRAIQGLGQGVIVQECDIKYPGQIGIDGKGRDFSILKNSISYATHSAIRTTNANANVYGNQVRNNSLLKFLGPDGMTTESGAGQSIMLMGDNTICRRNLIDSVGYSGVSFYGQNSVVDSNRISNACLTTSDCGAIYTWAGRVGISGSRSSRIARNIIQDASGHEDIGIYLDDGTHDLTVDNNSISGSMIGIYLHNVSNTTIRQNISYNNNIHIRFTYSNASLGFGSIAVDSNTLVSKTGQKEFEMRLDSGLIAPNYRPRGQTLCLDHPAVANCTRDGKLLWETVRLPERLDTTYTWNNTSSINNWIKWPTSLAIAANTAQNSMNIQCTSVANCKNALIYSTDSISGILPSQSYVLLLQAKSASNPMTLQVSLKEFNSNKLRSISAIKLDSTWKVLSVVYNNSTQIPSSQLALLSYDSNYNYHLRSISMHKIPTTALSNPPSARLFVNPTQADSTTTLQGIWKNLNGEIVPSISFKPFQPVVLLQIQKSIVIMPNLVKMTAGIRVIREGNRHRAYGLTSDAALYDIQGKQVGWVRPQPDGSAWIDLPRRIGPYWIRTRDQVSMITSL